MVNISFGRNFLFLICFLQDEIDYWLLAMFLYQVFYHEVFYLIIKHSRGWLLFDIGPIDLFAIWRKGLESAPPILTALATARNMAIPSFSVISAPLASLWHLAANSSYLKDAYIKQSSHFKII